MGMTRLRFLSMLSSSFALAAARPARLLAAAPTLVFSAEAFRPYINTTFVAHAQGTTVRLNLDAVEGGPLSEFAEEFTLVFSGPRSSALLEMIYRMTHAGLTPFDLELIPAGVGRDGRKLYRADFAVLKTA